MKYNEVVPAVFIERINRFLAKVLVGGKFEMVHVRNSGRCREILIPGTKIFLEKIGNLRNRKTKYSLISAYKGTKLINIDSQIPNDLVSNALMEKSLPGIDVGKDIKREVKYNNSRFDVMYHNHNSKGFIEVKGVTLEKNGIALFPDAPTLRGNKHVNELIYSSQKGFKNYIVFVIQMKGVHAFKPNDETDPVFGLALRKAHNEKNISIKAYDCIVKDKSIAIDRSIKILL